MINNIPKQYYRENPRKDYCPFCMNKDIQKDSLGRYECLKCNSFWDDWVYHCAYTLGEMSRVYLIEKGWFKR